MIAVLLVVALLVVAAAHYYVWRRLVHDTLQPGWARRTGTAIIVGLGAVLLLAFIGSRALPRMAETPIAWPAYLWLALLFYLLLILAVLELPAFIVRRLLRRPATGDDAAATEEPATSDDAAATEEPATSAATATSDDAAATEEPATSAATATGDDAAATEGPATGAATATGDQSATSEPAKATTRRQILARTVAITAELVSVGIVGVGVVSALGPPTVKRIQIPLAKLPSRADRTRIALVSDIHLGPLRGYSHTKRIVDLINEADADIVAIVGDLVDGSVEDLGEAASPLRYLRSRYGSFFVTGNHEYFSGFQAWVDEVASFGVRPLRNELVSLPFGLDLAGVNDQSGGGQGDPPDYDRALADRDPSLPVILLAHQPIQARAAAARGVDLQLSGHTHGGQMVPFNAIVRATGQPIVSGLGEVDGMPVYVTNGAGFWGPPVRVGAPPDITIVELRTP